MILDDISKVIRERKENPSPESYVSSLFARGKDEILKKIGEESVEVIIASKADNKLQIVHELADLWFHCLVLMAAEDIDHNDIFRELQKRFAKRGERHD
jgi:phosphoribosyl-ATP pyrophosphohydrolase